MAQQNTPSVSRGQFVWYELLANDTAAAADFYPKVIGWTTESWKTPPGAPPYTMWQNGAQAIGGLMELPPPARSAGAPSHWLGYVAVPDTDAAWAQARKLGATALMEPFDIPEVGRSAVLKDPQGAVFSLYTPKMTPGSNMPAPRGVGNVSWHELATDDWQKAWTFYEAMFGWKKGDAMDMGPMGTYQIFTIDGTPMGALFNRPPQIPVSNWLYYFQVGDLDQAVQRVKQGGGQILNGPMDVPGGRIAQCMDPQGAAFAMHWVKPG
jgi:predicted enzyme related to lactoylglutathione lyase